MADDKKEAATVQVIHHRSDWARVVNNIGECLLLLSLVVLAGHCGGCLDIAELIHGAPK
jgi:hypothetical protein